MKISRVSVYNTKEIEYLYNSYLKKPFIGISKYIVKANYLFYKVLHKDMLVGFFTADFVDDIVVIHEVKMFRRYYFKKAIDEVFNYFKELGFRAVVTKHDENTTYISEKHKIFERIK